VQVFRRAASQPSPPTGGEFDFEDGSWVDTPAFWFFYIPSGTDPVWTSTGIAKKDGETGNKLPISWGTVAKITGDGTPGLDGKSLYKALVFKRAPTRPSAPSGGSYDFGTEVLTPPTGWEDEYPEIPFDEPVWVADYTFSITGDTGSVGAGTWGNIKRFSGEEPISTYNFTVYREAASQPSTPSGGSYDFGTETRTPPSGWQLEPPTSPTDIVWGSRTTVSVYGSTNTVFSPQWSAPFIFVQPSGSGAPGERGASRLDIPVDTLSSSPIGVGLQGAKLFV